MPNVLLLPSLPGTVLFIAIVVIGVALLSGFFGREPFRATVPLVKAFALARWRSVTHGQGFACRKQDNGKEHQVEPAQNQSSFHDDAFLFTVSMDLDLPGCSSRYPDYRYRHASSIEGKPCVLDGENPHLLGGRFPAIESSVG
jgi:hypothetical protein